jgi:hypothetical protein
MSEMPCVRNAQWRRLAGANRRGAKNTTTGLPSSLAASTARARDCRCPAVPAASSTQPKRAWDPARRTVTLGSSASFKSASISWCQEKTSRKRARLASPQMRQNVEGMRFVGNQSADCSGHYVGNPHRVQAGAHFVGADYVRAFENRGGLCGYGPVQAAFDRSVFAAARQHSSDERFA